MTEDAAASRSPQLSSESRHVIALICCVVFMAVVNTSMINVALPFIGEDFGASEGTYGWVVTGYSLAFGIFNAVNGRLGDIFGLRRLYMVGIATLGLASLLLAASPSIHTMIGLRIIQGAGAAALPVMGTSILTQLIPPERRGYAMGFILSTVGVAASIAPFIGGLLVQFAHWRAVFAFSGVVLLAFPFAFKLLPRRLDDVQGQPFDLLGALLLSAGIVALVYGFEVIQGGDVGSLIPWLGGGLALLVLFALWIQKARYPFAPPSLFSDIRYVAAATVVFFVNATRFGTIVLVPIWLTHVNQLEPIWIGAVLFPGAVAIAVLSPRAGGIADRVGPRRIAAQGCLFIILGNLVAAYYAGGSPLGATLGMGLYGVGFALIQSPLISAVSKIVPRSQTGVGLGVFMMIFFVGGATGVALSVTTLELQPPGTSSWIGLDQGAGAPFSNAILVLTGLALVSLLAARWLPSGRLKDNRGASSKSP